MTAAAHSAFTPATRRRVGDMSPTHSRRSASQHQDQLRRTSEYKIKPIKAEVRRRLGYPHPKRVPAGVHAQMAIGISLDEIGRARDADVRYMRNTFPLLDLRWRRGDCRAFLRGHGLGDTPRSSCLGCPYHRDDFWLHLKENSPAEWADAVAFDDAIRHGAARANAAGHPAARPVLPAPRPRPPRPGPVAARRRRPGEAGPRLRPVHLRVRHGRRNRRGGGVTVEHHLTEETRPLLGSFCTGYGGLDLAAEEVLGARLAWYAENDPAASRVLAARFPGVANLGDIRAVDWRRVEPVDIVTAGFPCQDISNAGKRAGITGARSSLWTAIATALRVLRPRLAFVENVAALRTRGLDVVQADLATLGYHTRWLCLRASDIGAAHRRDRLFLLATIPGAGPGDAADAVRA